MSFFGTDHHLTAYYRDSRQLFGRSFLEVFQFTEGKGAVRDRSGAYYIDSEGKPLFGRKFIRTYPFMNGIAAVEDELGMFHIDSEGKELYSRRFGWVSDYSEGKCAARYRNGRYTFINISGEPTEETYRWCSDYRSGFAIILDDEGYAFVDTSGKRQFGRHFEKCGRFDSGKAPVRIDGKWHLIDTDGNIITKVFDMVHEGRNGLFTAISDNTLGYFTEDLSWEPLFELQKSVDLDEIPQWTDDILEREWDSCVVFIRHSERRSHMLCNSKGISNTGLTKHGDELARSIGEKIKSLNTKEVEGYCSGSRRCITTANCIMGGMGVQSKITESPEVGLEGKAFIFDNNYTEEDLRSPCEMEVVNLISEKGLKGWYDNPAILKNIHVMMERLLETDGKLTFCVNHDLFVIPPIAFITGRFPRDHWMDYCDGCLFVRKNGKISMIWKGKEYPFEIDGYNGVDPSFEPTGRKMKLSSKHPDHQWLDNDEENIVWYCEGDNGFVTLCDRDGRFFHGRNDEFLAYNRTFALAGEYSEQSAPVYIEGQGATHITDFADYLNNRWYLECRGFHEGLAAVRKESGWGYTNCDGNVIIDCTFSSAGDFHHGEAVVESEGKPCLIGRDGKKMSL